MNRADEPAQDRQMHEIDGKREPREQTGGAPEQPAAYRVAGQGRNDDRDRNHAMNQRLGLW